MLFYLSQTIFILFHSLIESLPVLLRTQHHCHLMAALSHLHMKPGHTSSRPPPTIQASATYQDTSAQAATSSWLSLTWILFTDRPDSCHSQLMVEGQDWLVLPRLEVLSLGLAQQSWNLSQLRPRLGQTQEEPFLALRATALNSLICLFLRNSKLAQQSPREGICQGLGGTGPRSWTWEI